MVLNAGDSRGHLPSGCFPRQITLILLWFSSDAPANRSFGKRHPERPCASRGRGGIVGALSARSSKIHVSTPVWTELSLLPVQFGPKELRPGFEGDRLHAATFSKCVQRENDHARPAITFSFISAPLIPNYLPPITHPHPSVAVLRVQLRGLPSVATMPSQLPTRSAAPWLTKWVRFVKTLRTSSPRWLTARRREVALFPQLNLINLRGQTTNWLRSCKSHRAVPTLPPASKWVRFEKPPFPQPRPAQGRSCISPRRKSTI